MIFMIAIKQPYYCDAGQGSQDVYAAQSLLKETRTDRGTELTGRDGVNKQGLELN